MSKDGGLRLWAAELLSLALLLLFFSAAASGLARAVSDVASNSLWQSALWGVILGWLLAVSIGRAWWAGALLSGGGALHAALSHGGLGRSVIAWLAAVGAETQRAMVAGSWWEFEVAALRASNHDLTADVAVLLNRLGTWMGGLVQGGPAHDPVVLTVLWGLVVWLLAAWAGWVFKESGRPLLAVAPALCLTIGLLDYSGHAYGGRIFLLAFSLLLMAVGHFAGRLGAWRAAGMDAPGPLAFSVAKASLAVTIGLVVVAALFPSFSLETIREWREARRPGRAQDDGGVAQSLGIRSAPALPADPFEAVRRPGLPQEQLIGSGPELSQRPVMSVEIGNLGERPQESSLPLYWRGLTYDVYLGSGWRAGGTEQKVLPGGEAWREPSLQAHQLLEQEVRVLPGEAGVVYSAGTPISLDRDYIAALRGPQDLFGMTFESGRIYRVRSLVPNVTEGQLRRAGHSYPRWVRSRYLQLPDDLPGRVRQLALDLTATEETPYDRAIAIESYLRTFPYTLEVERPPARRDVVDFFLFDLQRGYCDYYASAMVVLARAAGLPARLAVGFGRGSFDASLGRFIVSEAEAHSWTEVYFPEYGWIPFEPTGGRPSIDRPERPPIEVPAELTRGGPRGSSSILLPGSDWIWAALVAGALGVISAVGVGEWRLLRGGGELIYRRLRRHGAALQVEGNPGDTPFEFARSARQRYDQLRASGLISRRAAAAMTAETDQVLRAIVWSSYGPTGERSTERDVALVAWRRLRWRLRWARLRSGVDRIWRELLAAAGRLIEAGPGDCGGGER